MTSANQRIFREIGKRCASIAKENPPASACLYFILDTLRRLTNMATDFHFRPEANNDPS